MTAQEIVKTQYDNLSKSLALYRKMYKAIEVPESATSAAKIVQQYAASLQKGLCGTELLSKSLQQTTGVYKFLNEYDTVLRTLNTSSSYWEDLRKRLNVSSDYFSVAKVVANDDLLKTLEKVKNTAKLTKLSSFEGLTTGIHCVDEDLLEIVNAAYCREENSEEELISDLETDFKNTQELQDALEEQASDPVGFQERVANWTESKKKKYFIAVMILYFIWNTFLQPYIQENIGVPVTAWVVSNIRELPEKTSQLVGELKNDIEAVIIENVPYYYKVSFTDENGYVKEGYVSKRSVRLIEVPDEAECEVEREE